MSRRVNTCDRARLGFRFHSQGKPSWDNEERQWNVRCCCLAGQLLQKCGRRAPGNNDADRMTADENGTRRKQTRRGSQGASTVDPSHAYESRAYERRRPSFECTARSHLAEAWRNQSPPKGCVLTSILSHWSRRPDRKMVWSHNCERHPLHKCAGASTSRGAKHYAVCRNYRSVCAAHGNICKCVQTLSLQ